jgi:hypothetical protein
MRLGIMEQEPPTAGFPSWFDIGRQATFGCEHEGCGKSFKRKVC